MRTSYARLGFNNLEFRIRSWIDKEYINNAFTTPHIYLLLTSELGYSDAYPANVFGIRVFGKFVIPFKGIFLLNLWIAISVSIIIKFIIIFWNIRILNSLARPASGEVAAYILNQLWRQFERAPGNWPKQLTKKSNWKKTADRNSAARNSNLIEIPAHRTSSWQISITRRIFLFYLSLFKVRKISVSRFGR